MNRRKGFSPTGVVVPAPDTIEFYKCLQVNAMKTFENKIALVTGSAMGIGLSCAEGFAREGATVVMADIDETEVQKQAQRMTDEGYKAVGYKCDVSDAADVKRMIDWIVRIYGRLDAALNNADRKSVV